MLWRKGCLNSLFQSVGVFKNATKKLNIFYITELGRILYESAEFARRRVAR